MPYNGRVPTFRADMNGKSGIWLWMAAVAAATGAYSFYNKVKTAAIKHLNWEGMFDDIRQERAEAIQQVTGEVQPGEDDVPQTVNNPEVQIINERYRSKKRDIISKHHADNFTGALNILSPGEKNRALTFSAVNSIVAGGLTYALLHVASKARKNGRGSSTSDTHTSNSCSYAGSSHTTYGGGGHGHGCGHGCAGGCGGGCGA